MLRVLLLLQRDYLSLPGACVLRSLCIQAHWLYV